MPVLDCPIAKTDWIQVIDARDGVPFQAKAPPAEDAGPWEPAIKKIVEFQHLEDDWDGLGARAPARELLRSAVGLAYLLRAQGVNPPHAVVVSLDGSVIYEWHDPDGTYTEVEIDQPLHAEVMILEPGKLARHWTIPTD